MATARELGDVSAGEERTTTVGELLARLQPRPGDILLFHEPERWRGRLIRWFTRSPFYHVGIYAGEGHVIEARQPSVVCRDLTDLDGCRFVVVTVEDETARERALAWARERVGSPYDLCAIAATVLTRLLPSMGLLWCRLCREGRHVCGSFVSRAFSEGAGVTLIPDRSEAILVPGDYATLLREDILADSAPTSPLASRPVTVNA